MISTLQTTIPPILALFCEIEFFQIGNHCALGQSQVVGIAFTYAVCKSARGADRDKVSISEFGSSLDRFVSVSWKWN